MSNYSKVDVDFTTDPVGCSPDPVTVKKNQQDGYTFTGVTIDSTTYTPSSNGTGEFKDVAISTNGNKSVMTITDTVSDTTDHNYSVNYTAPDGTAQSFDPTIRNQN